MTTTRPFFAPWATYETWLMHLWITHDRDVQDAALKLGEQALMAQATEGQTRAALASELERYVRGRMPKLTLPWDNLLLTGLLGVDWPALAHAILDTVEDENPNDTESARRDRPSPQGGRRWGPQGWESGPDREDA